MDKFLIALITSCFTIPGTLFIKHFYDGYQKKARIDKLKKVIKAFISRNIILTLSDMRDGYNNIIKQIRSEEIVSTITQNEDFPWLNSKMFDLFSKDDLIEVLSKKNEDYELIAEFYQTLLEFDFLQKHSPTILLSDFIVTMENHHARENINEYAFKIEHYHSCIVLKEELEMCCSNVQFRISQIDQLLITYYKIKSCL